MFGVINKAFSPYQVLPVASNVAWWKFVILKQIYKHFPQIECIKGGTLVKYLDFLTKFYGVDAASKIRSLRYLQNPNILKKLD